MRQGDDLAQRQRYYGGVWFPSDNEYGIPTLDLDMQATELPEKWVKWGEVSRDSRRHEGQGVHFYTEDYKFAALWSKPYQVAVGGYGVATEVNYSTNVDMPLAWMLGGLYQKRYLARSWQDVGVRILVDLNVDMPARYALLGVPRGWRSYATRALDSHLDMIERDYATACEHAGTEAVLFVVFGGHNPTARLCEARGWTHVRERAEEVLHG